MMAKDAEVAPSFQPLLGLAANFFGSHETQVAHPMIEADKSTQKVSQGRTHEDILWKVLMRFDTRPGDGGGRQNITDLERRSEPWGEIKTIQVAIRDYQDLSVHNLLIYKDISKT
jgi:hypothetical protein